MSNSSRTVLLVFLLWFSGLGAAAQFAKIAIPFSSIQDVYPDKGSELGWLLSLISLMGAILGIVAGTLVSRVGPKHLLLLGMLVGASVSLWQSSFPTFHIMLFSRFVEGASHLAIVVAAPTLITHLSSDRYRGAAMALWSTFFGVAFTLVAWLGMPIVSNTGLDVFFKTHAMLMFVGAVMLAIGLKNLKHHSTQNRSFHLKEIIRVHRQAYGSPSISAPGIGWLFYTLTFVSLLAILPLQLDEGTGNQIAGIMSAVSIVAAMLLVPVLLKRATSVHVIIVGFMGAMFTALLRLFDVPLEIVCIALFVVLGLVQGASFSAVPELNNSLDTQALSYGLMAQMGNIGNLLGTPLLLLVFTMSGEVGLFLTVALLYVLAIVVHLVLKTRRKIA